MRVLILAATALVISAASASANGYRHHYGYGYATPVFEYEGGLLRLPGPVLYPYPLADICGSVDPCSARSFGVTVWLRTWLLGPWLLGRVRLGIWAALASQRFATKAPTDSTL